MKNTSQRFTVIALGLLTLSACSIYEPTTRPDYAIRVTPSSTGGEAVVPTCPSWATDVADPYDNQPFPQYGCSQARNLAMEIETPNDLVDARKLGDMRGVTAVGNIRRYDNNQTRGLIVPGAEDNTLAVTTSSAPASSLSGDVTGGASSSASSPAGASAAASP